MQFQFDLWKERQTPYKHATSNMNEPWNMAILAKAVKKQITMAKTKTYM